MTIGKKGSTIVFSIPGLVLSGNILSWKEFKFYTPVGNQEEPETGFKYFLIPADSILIERDTTLPKEVIVYSKSGIVYAQGFYESEEIVLPSFGLEGDILFTVFIPPAGDIIIQAREVTDDND